MTNEVCNGLQRTSYVPNLKKKEMQSWAMCDSYTSNNSIYIYYTIWMLVSINETKNNKRINAAGADVQQWT